MLVLLGSIVSTLKKKTIVGFSVVEKTEAACASPLEGQCLPFPRVRHCRKLPRRGQDAAGEDLARVHPCSVASGGYISMCTSDSPGVSWERDWKSEAGLQKCLTCLTAVEILLVSYMQIYVMVTGDRSSVRN